MSRRAALAGAGGLLALLALAFADLLQGADAIGAHAVLRALRHGAEGTAQGSIVLDVRLPRAAAGALAGGALAAAAVLLQALTRNRLAEPGTLGLTAGGGLAVAVAAKWLPADSGLTLLVVAGVGTLLGGLLVAAMALAAGAGPLRLILAGMAVTLALTALTSAIQLSDPSHASSVFAWGAGSLVQLGWEPIRVGALVAGAALLGALAMARALDVTILGEETARGLGQRAGLVRAGAALAAVALTAAAVGVVGPIVFVGLAGAAIARRFVSGHLALLALAVPWGGALVLAADVLTRLVLGSVQEVPAGIAAALLGAPLLIALARRVGPSAGAADPGGTRAARRHPRWALLAPLALVGVAGAGLCLGELSVSPGELVRGALGDDSPLGTLALNLRAPRLGVALLAGACLAVAGTLFQGVTRNPLASPELVGVSGGASVAAVAVLLVVPSAPIGVLPFAAAAGALVALVLVLALTGPRTASPAALALVGLGVTAACSGLTAVMVQGSGPNAAAAITFLVGSTYGEGWRELIMLAIAAAVLLPLAFAAARPLDVLGLGDEEAVGLGLPLARTRVLLLLLAAALAGAAVAVAGAIAFVGLVAPHAARLLVGARHALLLPLAAALGASLLAAGDAVGRLAFPPTEIPSGIVVTLIGAPYFAWLLLRSRAAAG